MMNEWTRDCIQGEYWKEAPDYFLQDVPKRRPDESAVVFRKQVKDLIGKHSELVIFKAKVKQLYGQQQELTPNQRDRRNKTLTRQYTNHSEAHIKKSNAGPVEVVLEKGCQNDPVPSRVCCRIPQTNVLRVHIEGGIRTSVRNLLYGLYMFDFYKTRRELRNANVKQGTLVAKNIRGVAAFGNCEMRFVHVAPQNDTVWELFWLEPRTIKGQGFLIGMLLANNIQPVIDAASRFLKREPTEEMMCIRGVTFGFFGTMPWQRVHIDGAERTAQERGPFYDTECVVAIPINLLDGSPPELLVMNEVDPKKLICYKYKPNEGLVIPASAYHSTAVIEEGTAFWEEPDDLRICMFLVVGSNKKRTKWSALDVKALKTCASDYFFPGRLSSSAMKQYFNYWDDYYDSFQSMFGDIVRNNEDAIFSNS